jgi:flavin reductase (DIM6/NTAB) family NADH-FMN oxidoreductase RutF
MIVDVSTTTRPEVFQTLVSVVAPRPIAWVTSINLQGAVNLAPFSFFNAFGGNPPFVVFSPSRRRDGTKKDTLNNVDATREFVVNVAVESLAEKVNLSSKEVPPDVSEVELTGLHTLPSVKVKPPRLAESPVNLECKVLQIVPIGDGPISGNLVIGEVLLIHIADEVLDSKGKVDPRKLKAIARLGADWYCRTQDLFEMKRP